MKIRSYAISRRSSSDLDSIKFASLFRADNPLVLFACFVTSFPLEAIRSASGSLQRLEFYFTIFSFFCFLLFHALEIEPTQGLSDFPFPQNMLIRPCILAPIQMSLGAFQR